MVGKGQPAAAAAPLPRDDSEEEEDTTGFVKLISAEGFEFVIDKKAAMVSNTLRNMLTSPGGFSETRHGEVRFPEIPTHILEKICQYFYWSLHYSSPQQQGPCSNKQFAKWAVGQCLCGNPHGTNTILHEQCQEGCSGKETAEFPIEPEITLELMMAANYLDT